MENDAPPPLNTPPPPPLSTPPPVITAPASTPLKKRRGWMIFSFILLVLLGFSALLNFGHFISAVFPSMKTSHTRHAGPKLDEYLIEDNDSSQKIAVVSVEGIITGRQIDQTGLSMVDVIKAQLKRAADERKVRAVILKVDSPGGEVLASDEIARAIEDFQSEAHKPVIVSMGSLAASGGYYVSAPCRWIVANDLTITGSIGVIMQALNYRGLMDKVGLRPMTFKSGAHKDMLSGSRTPEEIPADEREMIQALIDDTCEKFKDVVETGRKHAHSQNKNDGHALSEDWRDYADGRVLSGAEAEDLGFVDQLGNFDDAVKAALRIADISNANIIEYRRRNDFADLFGLLGGQESRAIKVDLGFQSPKVEASKMYFLLPAYLY